MTRFDVRLAIGSANGPRSNIWRIWSRRNQLYAAYSSIGGVEKLSFHTPRTCRHAFTREHGAPTSMADRVMHEWQRAETPPPGDGKASLVLSIGFPTDNLSTKLAPAKKAVTWVPAAPVGMVTVIEVFFTCDSEQVVRKSATDGRRKVVAYSPMANNEAFAVTSRAAEWGGHSFRMPASHHEKRDLVISDTDPQGTGRPVRLTIYNNPKDGDALIGWEYGGYWEEATSQSNVSSDLLSRNIVLDRKWNKNA